METSIAEYKKSSGADRLCTSKKAVAEAVIIMQPKAHHHITNAPQTCNFFYCRSQRQRNQCLPLHPRRPSFVLIFCAKSRRQPCVHRLSWEVSVDLGAYTHQCGKASDGAALNSSVASRHQCDQHLPHQSLLSKFPSAYNGYERLR